ncbi:unnamed protein product [Symbiodinium natans]|uniref:NarX-like N-terminal domain-containing protein n=1 Tax=Symbiodinium natans TaxID=878477 RepID=A0A812IBJ3_9DINO|nr:unnamed protein product [Symbiodinium natans]
MWSLLFFVVLARCQADWAETINLAGMQRTLSQMMTKEFLLISRGTDVEDNKRKLSESMASFDSTLNALLVGDSARGILAAPNQQVVTALENVNAVWVTMEALLRDNVDTVRHADGSLDMIVLEALSTQNVPLLDTSNEVVQAIVDAAKVSGATTNGLVQDIAGRQRTLIQRLAKGILFLAQGVAMTFNMQAYRNTKSLFETSHDGIIQGVPFAGLPVLDKLCTLHQMTEVSFYYAQIRPYLTGITNADTPSASQAAADEVAEEMCELTDPLFDAMVEAVKLFGDDDGNCDPAASMTQNDWLSYFSTLTEQQLLTQQTSQYFMQIALRIDVKTSKVEITVLTSGASMNLRNLIEGSKMLGIPAPPSQAVVDLLLKARETWDTLAAEMSQAVHLESISSVTVARVEQLSNYILVDLENVMQLSLSMANVSRAKAIDLASQQARLSSSMTEYACLISSGREVAENWDNLNATRAAFERNRWTLLEGAPATETGPAVEKMSDVCMVQQMKEATDLFGELELAALAASNGDMAALTPLVEVSPRAVKAFEAVALALQGAGTCRNGTLTAEEWIQRHQQVSELAILSQEVSAEFVILQQGKSPNRRQLDSLLLDIEAIMRRVLFGSFRPPVVH